MVLKIESREETIFAFLDYLNVFVCYLSVILNLTSWRKMINSVKTTWLEISAKLKVQTWQRLGEQKCKQLLRDVFSSDV